MPDFEQVIARGLIETKVPLARYTAARLGGLAEYLYVARESVEQCAEVLKAAWQAGVPTRVIGGGANVLISDAGMPGLVVINRLREIEYGDWHDGRTVSAMGGTSLQVFANECARHGLTGMEWAVGVPGTIGGAIVNNAGAHGADMSKSVADIVVLMADRTPQMLTLADMAYDYRTSALKQREDKRFLVLMATFCLPPGDPAEIRARMDEYNAYRRNTQPPGASLGSIFKNPPGDYAGRLIEATGLKGYQIGGAQVSPVHANFFINTGTATALDYYTLIESVRDAVQREHGVMLEPEIELLGTW